MYGFFDHEPFDHEPFDHEPFDHEPLYVCVVGMDTERPTAPTRGGSLKISP